MPRCTACSAPLPPHGTVCRYCGSRNDVDLRGIHEFTVTRPKSRRMCPRCTVPLQTIDLRGPGHFFIERCESCMGLFFDPGELQALLERSTSNVFRIDRERLRACARKGYHRETTVRYVPCPVCGRMMNRVAFGTRSGVVVDRCREHGVWLDGGELRRLLEWKKAGGELLHEKLSRTRKKMDRGRRTSLHGTGMVFTPAGTAITRENRGLGNLLADIVMNLFQ